MLQTFRNIADSDGEMMQEGISTGLQRALDAIELLAASPNVSGSKT